MNLPVPLRLDLGSGPKPTPGFVGVDLLSNGDPFVIGCDLASGHSWPFEDESAIELRSSHFIEHVEARDLTLPSGRRVDALAFFFEQAYRVAKAGAVFVLTWPALIDERTQKLCVPSYYDPSHRRFIPVKQLHYFSRGGRFACGVSHYDYRCNWVITRALQHEQDGGFITNEVRLVKEP